MYENGQGHLTLFCIVFVWLRGRPSAVRITMWISGYVSKPTRAIWRYLLFEFRALLCLSSAQLKVYSLFQLLKLRKKSGKTKLVVWWFDVTTHQQDICFLSTEKYWWKNSSKHVMNSIIVDKIYTDVWTTPSALNPSTRQVPVNNSSRPPSATPSSITSRPASAAAANTSTTSIGGPQTRPSSTGK